ncbi:UNVERIFIED_CONTAM: Mediator of RNA polymerase II transcription subunit [Sesamum angustifolium]|uniref:Mediator of RNA polymerase II transcription subunit n=1 Tax=Sesamum angustifolium TaxID=2727405 RepID=A0AAW2M804_9LAMI
MNMNQNMVSGSGSGSGASGTNMPLNQQPVSSTRQLKYVKVWEGNLSGPRQGQPIFITRLEFSVNSFYFCQAYRSVSASETLAANWPPVMQIVRLISQDLMNKKHYVGKVDFLVFRALNQHGFLGSCEKRSFDTVTVPDIAALSFKQSLSVGRSPSPRGETRYCSFNLIRLYLIRKYQVSSNCKHNYSNSNRSSGIRNCNSNRNPFLLGSFSSSHFMQIPQQQQQQQQMVGTGMNQAYKNV